jgi:hypothetical protein
VFYFGTDNQVAIVFGDGGSQIVEPDLTACAGQDLKSLDVTADEGSKVGLYVHSRYTLRL